MIPAPITAATTAATTGAHRVRRFLNAYPWAPVLLGPLLLIYLRAPDAFHQPNLWAEDGLIFFTQLQELGTASILTPYNGYLHLAPRLVAALAGVAPLEQTVRIYFLASLAAALWTSATIYLNSPRRGIARPLFLLPFLALSATEVLASPTNLQWVLATGVIVAVLGEKARSPAVRANTLLFAAVAGLSGPFALFALAAAVGAGLLARRRPSREQGLILAVLAATVLAQAGFVVAHYAPGGGGATLAKALKAFAGIHRKSMGGSVETAVISATVVLGVVLGGAAVSRARYFRLGLLLFALILTSAIALRFSVHEQVFPTGIPQRYRYVQSVAWVMILLSMVVDGERRWLRGLAVVSLALYAAALLDGAFVREPRPKIDDWAETVRAAEQGPVAYRYPPGWSVIVHGR